MRKFFLLYALTTPLLPVAAGEVSPLQQDEALFLIWSKQAKTKDSPEAIQNKNVKALLQGRLDFFRSCAIHKPLPDSSFQDARRGIAYATGIEHPFCNGVMGKTPDVVPTDVEIARAIKYFKSRNLPFIWWTSAEKMEEKGFIQGGAFRGVVLDISESVDFTPINANLKIIAATTDEKLKVFSETLIKVHNMDPATIDQFRAVIKATMQNRDQIHFIAYLDETPVGVATLATNASAAGIWNLGTLKEHRRAGVGKALIQKAITEAQKHGYKSVMAILKPDDLAWRVYEKLGFYEVCQFPFYEYDPKVDQGCQN